jgi:hypothetical protein
MLAMGGLKQVQDQRIGAGMQWMVIFSHLFFDRQVPPPLQHSNKDQFI